MGEEDKKALSTEEQKETLTKKKAKIELSPSHFESRQRAHAIKVAKFLTGGEF